MRHFLLLFLALSLSALAVTPSLEDPTPARLAEYVRIDTSNPPGNELVAARFLKGILEAEGVPATIYPSSPTRGCLVAIVHGDGTQRPIVLLNHMDVVPAVASEWKVPPFSGAIRDGYIWGRGTIDMKSVGIMQLSALLALHRSGVKPHRDVIFMAVSDEERGGEFGTNFMLKQHWDLLHNVEYVLDEGTRGVARGDQPLYWEVVPAEKVPLWLRLVTHGTGGHGSRPSPGIATHRLARALGRVAAWLPPVHIRPEVQDFFATVARFQPGPRREWFADIASSVKVPAVLDDLNSSPDLAALVRDTVAITVLKGSTKTNVIPSEASAELDCRLLPDTDADAFLHQLTEVIGDDQVHIEIIERDKSFASPVDSPVVRTIRQILADELPGVPVVTPPARAASDSRFFREHGIAAYGFTPIMMDDDLFSGMHGVDERISIANLKRGVRIMSEVVARLAHDDK